jgi:hypothetical protein
LDIFSSPRERDEQHIFAAFVNAYHSDKLGIENPAYLSVDIVPKQLSDRLSAEEFKDVIADFEKFKRENINSYHNRY